MSDRVTEKTTIAAPVGRVLEILLDFPRYPEWARDLKEIEELAHDDEGRATSVRFRAGGMGRSTTYTLEYDHTEPGVLAWRQTEGDITRKLDGRYVLAEHADDPAATEVTYELEVELVVPLPSFVKRRTQGKIMHAALDELKAIAEQVAP
jgi:carbon monoxide dehydrogenase subunit G